MGDIGKIGITPNDVYNDLLAYERMCIVTYNGGVYLSKQDTQGNLPTDTTNWMFLCKSGSMWYTGTGITGTSATPSIFVSSGVAMAQTNDMYLNTNTGNIYQCTLGGDASTATWLYKMTITGGGGGGTAAWSDVTNKPFTYIGTNGLKTTSDTLDVDFEKVQAETSTLTEETAIVDADTVPFYDASANGNRKSTWANIVSVLKTKFDTLYNNYSLPTATASTKGGIKVGAGLSIVGEVLSAAVKGLISSKTDFWAQTESTGKAVDSKTMQDIAVDIRGIALPAATLTAGATSLVFTDAEITTDDNTFYDVYAEKGNVAYTDVVATREAGAATGTLTITFVAQTVDVSVTVLIRRI